MNIAKYTLYILLIAQSSLLFAMDSVSVEMASTPEEDLISAAQTERAQIAKQLAITEPTLDNKNLIALLTYRKNQLEEKIIWQQHLALASKLGKKQISFEFYRERALKLARQSSELLDKQCLDRNFMLPFWLTKAIEAFDKKINIIDLYSPEERRLVNLISQEEI